MVDGYPYLMDVGEGRISGGYVYLMYYPAFRIYKIGYTLGKHPELRRRELDGYLPRPSFKRGKGISLTREQREALKPLRLLWFAVTKHPEQAEAALHARFKDRRVNKYTWTVRDWFALTQEDVEEIRRMENVDDVFGLDPRAAY